jgi:hypothetical protein
MQPDTYIRILQDENPPRRDVMVEVEPHQYVNLKSGIALGLIGRRIIDAITADDRVSM